MQSTELFCRIRHRQVLVTTNPLIAEWSVISVEETGKIFKQSFLLVLESTKRCSKKPINKL